MNVLVTGGLGYIGSHTAVALLERNHDVVVVDNLYNADRDVKERIEKITGKSIKFYEGDCVDPEAMERIFAENDIDCVIHFAGYKAVGESVRIPTKYYRNNLDSALTVLETMKNHNCNVFVFSSSATVYRADQKSPLNETMELGASNPYGWTKVMIERFMEDLAVADEDFCGISLRYFNPIGAHESTLLGEKPVGIPNNLMPYICQVADGTLEYLHVFGDDYDTPDGTGVRDYIHVVDLALGHVAALEKLYEQKGMFKYNLGTGRGTSVLELVNAFQEATGVEIPYQIEGRRPGDLATVYADPAKAEQDLGWKATRTIKEACASSWAFQQGLKK
ncbi:MAG: UDP-glucose 4-epimerase GalE [Peptoniphilaceae bacterium]|nr:UDP-glucose 4-epimerase GalE [Peptoniphilaceae bacterium]MDY6086307.1 UDP-glucose 4-epimerase GalE [Peptoniphilaceae bacterium]